MLAIEVLVEEILRLQNTICFLQAQLREAKMSALFYVTTVDGQQLKQWATDEAQARHLAWVRTGKDAETVRQEQPVQNAQELINRMCASPLVIRYAGDDQIIHTDEHPFCGDEMCPCMDALYAEIERREQEV